MYGLLLFLDHVDCWVLNGASWVVEKVKSCDGEYNLAMEKGGKKRWGRRK